MRLSHYFGSQTRKHLVGRIRGGNEQTNSRRISLPFLDTTLRSSYAQLGRGAVGMLWFARQEVRIVIHYRIPLIDAQGVESVNKLGRKFVHKRTGEVCSLECMFRNGGGCR